MSFTPLFGPGPSASIERNRGLPVIDNRELTFLEHVARGGMAQISLYNWNRRKQGHSSMKVAKKSLFRGSIEARYEERLKKEMDLLAQLEHKNIVTTYGIVETDHDFGLVMEYLRFGSCRHFFQTLRDKANNRFPNLDETLAPIKIQIIEEVIDGMSYLHGLQPKKVLHLDLKSDNVLLDDNLHAKICDFGLSRMATLTMLRSTTTANIDGIVGTPGYIPPETFQNPKAKSTSKSDVYSFAIFVWELLTDRMPYEDIDCRQINLLKVHVVHDEGRPEENRIPDVYPQELINMIKQAWSPRPEDRQSFEDLRNELNHLKQHNPEIVQKAHDSMQQTLGIWELLCASSIVSDVSGAVRDESYNWSTCRSDPTRSTRPNMTETTPKRHTDHTVPYQIGHSFPDDDELLVPPPEPQDKNNLNSSILLPHEEKECPYVKILLAIATALLVFGGGGVLIWIEVTKQSACPHLSKPPNGNITCSEGDDKCWFSCQNGYSIVGATTLLCRDGKWNGTSPICVPDCPAIAKPVHGNISCTAQSSTINEKCTFSCQEGYSIRGESALVCSGGKWSGKPPICVPDCPALHQIDNGHFKCSDGFTVNSTCSFTCDQNYKLKGNTTATCLKSRKWSAAEPKCECPPCYIGYRCEDSINWKDVLDALRPMEAYGTINVPYGGESFTCTNHLHSILVKWTGVCTDTKTGIVSECSNNYVSPRGSAMHAAADLVRKLVAQKKYPSPCDPQDMDQGC